MAMGRRKNRTRTPGLWIAANELPRTGGHPFYLRLNQVLDAHAFDEFVEAQAGFKGSSQHVLAGVRVAVR